MSDETGGSLIERPAYPAVAWLPAPAQGSEPLPADPPAAPVDEPVPAEPESPEPAESPEPSEPAPDPELPDAEPGALFPAPEPRELGGAQLRAALEAVLLVVDEPVSEATLADVVEQPADRVAAALTDLSTEYTEAGRGYDLRRAAGGWRLYTRAEQAPYVERFVLDGQQARLTQAALETLAVIAYRQPVTRPRISAIRGVNCDGVVRTLMTRGLVEEGGTEPETGAHLYRTTGTFLEKLGLDSLDQLPPLAPFLPDDVEALNPDAPDPVDEAGSDAVPAPDPAGAPALADAPPESPEPDHARG